MRLTILGDNPIVSVDVEQLKIVFLNLLLNAVQAIVTVTLPVQ